MPFVRLGKQVIWHPSPSHGPTPGRKPAPAPKSVRYRLGIWPLAPGPEPTPALKPALIHILLRQLIETCIEYTRKHPAGSRDDIDRLLKSRNPNLYYNNLHIKYYYFCQKYKDHFEITALLGHNQVFFAANFLKKQIFN